MNLKNRAQREQKKKNNRNRKVVWFKAPYSKQVSTNIVKVFLTSWISIFLKNIDYTRSVMEIMLRLVIPAQKLTKGLKNFLGQEWQPVITNFGCPK